MALAYGIYRAIGSSIALTDSGLIAFTAVAQFAPALIGGLARKRVTALGTAAGISVGFIG